MSLPGYDRAARVGFSLPFVAFLFGLLLTFWIRADPDLQEALFRVVVTVNPILAAGAVLLGGYGVIGGVQERAKGAVIRGAVAVGLGFVLLLWYLSWFRTWENAA